MKKIKKFFKSESGFTLIELLVVIGIIAILATIGAVNFASARSKARDAKRLSDLKQISAAIEVAAAGNPNGLFPTTEPAELSTIVATQNDADDSYCYYYPSTDGFAGAVGGAFPVGTYPARTVYLVAASGMENADAAGGGIQGDLVVDSDPAAGTWQAVLIAGGAGALCLVPDPDGEIVECDDSAAVDVYCLTGNTGSL